MRGFLYIMGAGFFSRFRIYQIKPAITQHTMRIKQPKRKSTKLKVKITVEQIAWHKSHERHGGLSYFLVKKGRNVYLFKGSSGRALALGLTQDHFEKLAIAKDWISIETCIKANKNFII